MSIIYFILKSTSQPLGCEECECVVLLERETPPQFTGLEKRIILVEKLFSSLSLLLLLSILCNDSDDDNNRYEEGISNYQSVFLVFYNLDRSSTIIFALS